MGLISFDFMAPRKLELGQIKIGGKGAKKTSAGGNDFAQPVKYDHFIVTTMERDKATDNYIKDARIHAIVGERPVELDGFLMDPEVEDNFHSEMARWEGRTKKVSQCDGKVRVDLKTGVTEPCQCANMPREQKRPCKPYMRLHIQLLASGTSLGYHVFRSTSYRSTAQIQSALVDIKKRFGTLYGAPVRLHCFYTQDRYFDGTKERTGKSLKVGLSLRLPTLEAFAVMREHREALEAAKAVEFKGLLAPVSESARETVQHLNERDKEEEADIAAEFSPQAENIDASIATQQTLDGLVQEFVTEADWEVEEDDQQPVQASREECVEKFNEAVKAANLAFGGVIRAWARASDAVPDGYPDEWTGDHFLYAAEVVKDRDGVNFLIPYLFEKLDFLPEDMVNGYRVRTADENYTRAMCDADLKEAVEYKKEFLGSNK